MTSKRRTTTRKKACPLGVCKKAGKSSRGGGVAKRPPSNPLPTPPPNPVKQNNLEDVYTEDDISDDEQEVVTRASLLKQQVGQTVKSTIKGAVIAGAISGAVGCAQGAILGAPLGAGAAIAGCTNHGLAAAKQGAMYGAAVGGATGLGRTALEQTLFEPKHPEKSLKRAKRIGNVVEKTVYAGATILGGYNVLKGGPTNQVNNGSQEPPQVVDPVKMQVRVDKAKTVAKRLVKGINEKGQLVLESNTLQTVANLVSKPASEVLKAINKDKRLLEAKAGEVKLKKQEANRIVSDIVDGLLTNTMTTVEQKEWDRNAMEDITALPSTGEAQKLYESHIKTAEMWEDLKAKSRGMAPMEVSTTPLYTNNKTVSVKTSPTLPPLPLSPTISSPSAMSITSNLPPLPLSPTLSSPSTMSIDFDLLSAKSPSIAGIIPGTTPAQGIKRGREERLFDPTGFYDTEPMRKVRTPNETPSIHGPFQPALSYRRRRNTYISKEPWTLPQGVKRGRDDSSLFDPTGVYQLPSSIRRRRNPPIKSAAPVMSQRNSTPLPTPTPPTPVETPSLTSLPKSALDTISRGWEFYESLPPTSSKRDIAHQKSIVNNLVEIGQMKTELLGEPDVSRQKQLRSTLLQKIHWLNATLQ